MTDVGSLKVKKKIYNFSVRKRYQHLGHYKVRKQTYTDMIKNFQKSFSQKKEEKKTAVGISATPPEGGLNVIVLVTFIMLGLITLAIGFIYLSSQFSASTPGAFQSQAEKPGIENTILNGRVLDAGDIKNNDQVAALLIDYKTKNLQNYTINITTYKDRIPSEVFVLDSERFEATTYPDFIRNLREDLGKRKTVVNDITVNQLETMPQGAIVIVPSGVIPQEMLGINSKISIDKLAEKGIVVIYVGQPFTKMLRGTLVVSTPQEIVQSLPFDFNENTPLQSTGNFNLFQPLYQVTPRSQWASIVEYGSVSIAKKRNGAYIFVPQTLDGGWRGNATSAAQDIATIITEIPWSSPDGNSKIYEFGNSANLSGTSYFFSNTFKGTNETVKVDFVGYSAQSAMPIEQTSFFTVEKQPRGSLYIENGFRVVSTNVTNNFARINAKLREPVPAQPSMAFSIVDANNTEVQNIPQGNVDDQAEGSFDVPIYANNGEYIVKLADDAGKVYAETYLKVVSINIAYNPYNSPNAHSYAFDITMDGNPVKLQGISASVDKGQEGTYKFSGVSSFVIDVGQYTGGDHLSFGTHTFEFQAGGLKVSVNVPVERQRSLFTDPIFYFFVIISVLITGAGVIFARREDVYYSVDIPDFPPVARTKIALSKDVVLSIFEKVNENYRWQNTPLTPSEVKNGFKEIFYKGKPTFITDYNVEYLLDELEKKGLLSETLGYYGLNSWKDRTRKTIGYLALLRRLRDICVNNAVPFTPLDESKVADSEVTVAGQQMFLHFFEPGMDLKNIFKEALATIGKGITIILFKNDSEKKSFDTVVHSPSAAPLIMKMEKEGGSVLFLSVDEFEKMLKEFKSI